MKVFCSEDVKSREVNWLAQQMKDVGDAAAKMKQIFVFLFLSPRAARSKTLWSPEVLESLIIFDKQPFIAVKMGFF